MVDFLISKRVGRCGDGGNDRSSISDLGDLFDSFRKNREKSKCVLENIFSRFEKLEDEGLEIQCSNGDRVNYYDKNGNFVVSKSGIDISMNGDDNEETDDEAEEDLDSSMSEIGSDDSNDNDQDEQILEKTAPLLKTYYDTFRSNLLNFKPIHMQIEQVDKENVAPVISTTVTATTVSPPIPLVNKKPKRMFTIKMNTPNATSTPSRPIDEQQQQQQPPKRPDILSICREYSLNRSSTMSKSMLTTMMTPSSEKKKFSIKWNPASSSLSSSATSAVAATTSKRIRSDPIMDLLRNKVADKSAIKS